MRVGFAGNPEKDGIVECREAIMTIARRKGCACAIYDSASAVANDPDAPDFLVVIGGDGSLLRFASPTSEKGVPILGVNLGRIGFLSEIAESAFDEALTRIQAGDYSIDERKMLSCRVNGGEAAYCLNDILVFKHSFSGTIQVDIEVDDRFVGTVFCDGVIASTPTGSTAYTLSAGGPVIAPGLDAIVMTPVCSHTLHIRPVVAASGSVWRFTLGGKGFVAADGVKIAQAAGGDCVLVTGAERKTRFIRFGEKNIFDLIQRKLS